MARLSAASQEKFRTVSLKTASAVAHIPVFGDFTIKLQDVKLDGLDLDQASTGISLGEDGSFVLLVSGLAAIVEGHFQWRRNSFPFISGGCQAKVTAEVCLNFLHNYCQHLQLSTV